MRADIRPYEAITRVLDAVEGVAHEVKLVDVRLEAEHVDVS